MEAGRIVDEIAGVDLEEAGQSHAGRVGQVRALAALDLREVGLADVNAELFADGVGDGLLRQLAVLPAERAFNVAEIAELFADSHNRLQYPNCNP